MKYRKSDASNAAIIAAATRVLARQGYARTSLMDIAREAQLSKGAVHYHFPTKQALIAKVLEHACNAVAERARVAWEGSVDPVSSIRAALRELWRMRAERTDEAAVVTDLLALSIHDESLRPELASYYRFAASQLEIALRAYLEPFGVTPRIPFDLLPRVLNGLLDGLVMQHLVDPGSLDENLVISTLETIAQAMFAMPASPPRVPS